MQTAKYSGECLTSGHLFEDLMPCLPKAAFSMLMLSLRGQLGLACTAYLKCSGSMRGHGKGQKLEEMYAGWGRFVLKSQDDTLLPADPASSGNCVVTLSQCPQASWAPLQLRNWEQGSRHLTFLEGWTGGRTQHPGSPGPCSHLCCSPRGGTSHLQSPHSGRGNLWSWPSLGCQISWWKSTV